MKHLSSLNSFLVALVLLSVTLVSCSKDDDASPKGDASKFVGDWTVTAIYKDGDNLLPAEPLQGEGYESNVAFTKSGAFSATLDIDYDGEEWTNAYFGEWEMTSSNVIEINGDYELRVKKITETELNYEFEDEDYGLLEVRSVRAE